jgi:hypothetical protein
MTVDQLIYLFVPVVVVVGLGLLVVITKMQPKRRLDTKWFETRWRNVEAQFDDGQAGQSLAVVNADKLLDTAMQRKGFKGKTMGERLKNHPNAFADINAVWRAHKLRNQIAHEHVQVYEVECRNALQTFRQALKDVGAVV